MSIQGVRTSIASGVQQTEALQGTGRTVRRSHNAPTSQVSYERELPLVSEQTLVETASASEVPEPNPDADPIARAGWIEMRLAKINRINQLIRRLETTGNRDDDQYRTLHDRLTRAKSELGDEEALSDELASYEDLGLRPEDDLDGNGVANARVNLSTGAVTRLSPDTDGDGLTDNYEDRLGTDRYSDDSDGDGLSDYDEVNLSNYAGLENLDPTRADSLHEGVLDSLALPRSVQNQVGRRGANASGGGANPTRSTTTSSSSGRTGGDSGVTTQSEDLLWPRAQESEIYNANGDVTFRRDGRNLIINDRTINNYFDEQGHPNQRLYIRGTVNNVTYYNMSASDLSAVAADDGVSARAGVHFDRAPAADHIHNVVDLFNGSVPMHVSGNEIAYDSNGITSQISIPDHIDGQEVKQVAVRKEGNDIIFEAKTARGQILKSFRLRDSADEVEGGRITFKLANNGQLFDYTDGIATVEGGNGNDIIRIGGGSASGGRGNDLLIASVSDETSPVAGRGVTFRGGEGDDMLVGSDAVDQLYGDAGSDLLLSGNTREGDTMNGGVGSDIIIGQNSTGSYNIDGGGENDISNMTASGRVRSIELGPSQSNQVITHIRNMIRRDGIGPGDRLNRLNEAIDTAETGGIMSANAIRDLMLSYSNTRISSAEEEMGILHSGDIPALPSEGSDTGGASGGRGPSGGRS